MYTPPGRARGARPRASRAGWPRPPARRRRSARSSPAAAAWARPGRRASRSCRPRARRPGARGRGRASASCGARRCSATRSFVQIISCSISPCASVCSTDCAAITSPVGVELELRLRGRDLQRRAAAPSREHGRGAAREVERGRDRLGGPLAAGEELVELVVGEARVGADPAAVEARRARRPVGRELDLRRHRQPLDTRGEAAGLVGEHRAAASARPCPGT